MGRHKSFSDVVILGDDSVDHSNQSIRDRFPFKRNPNPTFRSAQHNLFNTPRRSVRNGRSFLLGSARKFFSNSSVFYVVAICALLVFILAPFLLQSSINSDGNEGVRSIERRYKIGDSLKFVASLRFLKPSVLDLARHDGRLGIRPPRLAIILSSMEKDPYAMMLFTVIKNLKNLGYLHTIFSLKGGEVQSAWKQLGDQLFILNSEKFNHIDWTIFEGIIVDSIEARLSISSLIQEPFCFVPIIWIVHETTLGSRLLLYKEMGLEDLVSYWKNSFTRADVIVFPDFSMPMLHSALDSGNFFVINGPPVDVWSAEKFSKLHSRHHLRALYGFDGDDILVVIIGSLFYYNGLSWDYVMAMHKMGPLITEYARKNAFGQNFRFAFLCGNFTDNYTTALEEVGKHLGLHHGSLRQFGLTDGVNEVLSMADVVIYDSFQDEQGFPPLLTRAMTFGIPIMASDYPVIRKFIVDGVHGIIFPRNNPDELIQNFSLLITDGKLSKLARVVASSGRLLAKNMFTSECVKKYALLLEQILTFPSDTLIPLSPDELQLQQVAWDWDLFTNGIETGHDVLVDNYWNSSFVYTMEDEFRHNSKSHDISGNETVMFDIDLPSKRDWDILYEIKTIEDKVNREMDEIDERTERDTGSWDEVYHSARKSEKIRFETNERDEGELERTGQPVCIYEIYDGVGAWPFLHHGSMYRGLSLSASGQRLYSDDLDAVGRLAMLNDTYYRDMICEVGGMFSVAKRIDNAHKRPWIGFQSWRTTARKISLSNKAEHVLEEIIQNNVRGDVIYFWATLNTEAMIKGHTETLTFWSVCDILNGGRCRAIFEDAFRHMYFLPPELNALPTMPDDGGLWSALHSWVMPTPSFLEFTMFSRMFVDSLHALHNNSRIITTCLLGSSELERRHCYCRVMELVVNVWAYHSGRRMVYINPVSGEMEEQHPLERRRERMQARFFNSTLLKNMDEDMAEATDDGERPEADGWLWPMTGEVQWRGVYEREREERYRKKMEKKRLTKEKLLDRMKHGYKQKSLG